MSFNNGKEFKYVQVSASTAAAASAVMDALKMVSESSRKEMDDKTEVVYYYYNTIFIRDENEKPLITNSITDSTLEIFEFQNMKLDFFKNDSPSAEDNKYCALFIPVSFKTSAIKLLNVNEELEVEIIKSYNNSFSHSLLPFINTERAILFKMKFPDGWHFTKVFDFYVEKHKRTYSLYSTGNGIVRVW